MVARRYARWFLIFVLLLLVSMPAWSASTITVPDNALRFKRQLIRTAWFHWGIDAPIRVFAAQTHQESHWRTDAKSHVGAQGLAQFMPSTTKWISGLHTEALGNPDPFDPRWALQALVLYDKFLLERVKGHTYCDRMAKTLAAYNGGLGWVYRDEKLAAQNGFDSLKWFGSVELFNAGRSAANKKENREYPHRILKVIQPAYESWGDGVECKE